MRELPERAGALSERIGRCFYCCRGAVPVALIALLVLVAPAVDCAPKVALAQTAGLETAGGEQNGHGLVLAAAPAKAVGVCKPEPIYTMTQGISSQPSMSPGGDYVAFWSTGGLTKGNPDGSIELFMLDTINKELTQLTNSHGSILGGFNLAPSFNAQGNLVVFYSDRNLVGENSDENFEIFMYHMDTGTFEQVTHTDRGVSVSPAISAGGDYVAFATDQDLIASENPEENLEIFRIRVANGSLLQITHTGEGETSDLPSISDDGKLIAFVSTADLTGRNPDGNLEIFLYRYGSGMLQITETTPEVTNDYPALSAHGTHVVYTSDWQGNQRIYLYDIATGVTTAVTTKSEGSSIYPSINGEGTLIAFASNEDLTGDNPGHTMQVFLYNPNSNPPRTTQISDASKGGITSYPSLSAYGADTTFIAGGVIYKTNCPEADLALAKTASAEPVVAGTTLTYTLTVRNNGPLIGEDIVVTDTLPATGDVQYAGYSTSQGECDEDGKELVCKLSSLGVGDRFEWPIEVAVEVDPAAEKDTEFTNTATVDGYVNDPYPDSNTDQVTTTVVAEADLGITKSDSPDPVVAGEDIVYSLIVTNHGPSDSTAATVTDPLPTGLHSVAFDASPGVSCRLTGSDPLSCDIGLLKPGERATISVDAKVKPSARNTLVNTATVDGEVTDPDTSNNQRTQTTTIDTVADLEVTKDQRASPGYALAGETWTYTMTVTNAGGPSDATGVVLTDTLPISATFASASDVCDGAIDGTDPVTCSLGTLSPNGPGATKTVTLTVLFDQDLRDTVTNRVTVAGAEDDPDGATASLNTEVKGQADLFLDKTSSPAIAGTPMTYTLHVHNYGPSSARAVAITDTLPLSIPHGPAVVTPQGTCAELSGTVTCSVGTLDDEGDVWVTIPMTLTPELRGTLTNTAMVASAEYDPGVYSNTATLTTTIGAEADLRVSKVDEPDPVVAGDNLRYTLTVTNDGGPSLARDVVLTDTLPENTSFVIASEGCGLLASGEVTCTIGELNPNDVKTATIWVRVGPSVRGDITNKVTAVARGGEVDADGAAATESTNVYGQATLDLQTHLDPLEAVAGASLTYTLSVHNYGPSDALTVTLTDTLPVGVEYDSTKASPDSCTESAGTFTCDLGDIAAGGNAYASIPITLPASLTGVLTNTAAVWAADPATATDSETLVTPVETRAGLQIAKMADPTVAIPGEPLTYTLVVTNTGPSDARDVVVTDTLPEGTTFRGASAPGTATTVDGGAVVVWDLDSIAFPGAEATRVLTVAVDVLPWVTRTLANSADVSSSTDATAQSVTHADCVVPVEPHADLAIGKLDAPDPVEAGRTLQYTLVYTNNGPSDAQTVAIADTLPDQVTMGSVVSVPSNWTQVTGEPTWTTPTLSAGAYGTIVFYVSVDELVDHVITNTVEISSSTLDDEPGNDSAEERTDIDADLAITQTVVPTTATPGEVDSITYYITVTNPGPSAVVGATVSDQFPGPGVFVGDMLAWTCGSSLGSACTENPDGASTLADTITLLAGEVVTYTAIGPLDPSAAAASWVNTATVTLPPWAVDRTPDDNWATTTLTLTPRANLIVTKTVDITRPNEDDLVTYFVTLRNNGPSDAKNVLLEDLLPDGLTYQAPAPPNPKLSYDTQHRIVTWDAGKFDKKRTSATVEFYARVDPAAAGDIIANTKITVTAQSPANPVVSIKTDGALITVNSPPIAADDEGPDFTTDEDTAFTTGDVLTNDTDVDLDLLTVSAFDATGTTGTVTYNGDGTFHYDPDGQFEYLGLGDEATDTFLYTIGDGYGGTASASVTIAINGMNDAPNAVDDTSSTDEDTALAALDVLVNDTDPDTNGDLTVTSVDTTTNGTKGLVSINVDDTISYNPNGQFEGLGVGQSDSDTFRYTISDGHGGTDTATVALTVTGVNDAPVITSAAAAEAAENQTSVVTVEATDRDAGDTVTFSVSGGDDASQFSIGPSTGDLTFKAAPDYENPGSFDGDNEYLVDVTASDDDLASTTLNMTVMVTDVNDPPVAVPHEYSTPQDTVLAEPSDTGVLSGVIDVDSTVLTATVDLDVTSGTLNLSADGSFVYTPTASYTGDVTFTYAVSDGLDISNAALVTVTVTPASAGSSVTVLSQATLPVPPELLLAASETYTTAEDIVLTVPAEAGILSNDQAPFGVSLTATLDLQPITGTLDLELDGSFVYTPTMDYSGLVTFTYHANAGASYSNVATVTLVITPVNDAPLALDDAIAAVRSLSRTIEVLGNDWDPDGDSLFVLSTGVPLSGTACVGPITGTVVYTPTGFYGTDVLTYTASDGVLTDTATVTVTVQPFTVTVAGPPAGVISGGAASFTATVELTATLPLTYTWEATGQLTPALTHASVARLTDTAVFTWTMTGSQTLTVTVSNGEGTLSDTMAVPVGVEQVYEWIYLPLVVKGG